MGVFKLSPVDILFTCLGLGLLLLDIVLDIVAVWDFYREEDYVSLCILLLLLVGSSVLVQAFSWLWYSYEDDDQRQTKVEKCLTPFMLKFLHVLQLGMYFRHAGVVELSLCRSLSDIRDPESVAVYLNHDLSMLRLIETFSESAPQLALMLTIMLQSGKLGPVKVLKACGSASAIAFSVTMYHRSLRSFLPNKEKQRMMSSAAYFLWNLLLISSRITALALFASVLPCFVVAHFFCSWIVLFFFVWWSETDFMDSPCGEWLYRATMGLIWYFDWFNVADGRTRYRTLLYHGYMLVDISLLCSLWCWKMSPDLPDLEIPPLYAVITAVSVVAVYILGLLLKMLYYTCYHPNLAKEELKGDATVETKLKTFSGDEPDFSISSAANEVPEEIHLQCISLEEDLDTDVTDRSGPGAPAPDIKRCNKRMRKLAENFYS
ncbi:XK-related protein 8-like [Anarrhichthys ocellatus]|uniref:XK-related protein 8-like n=1 Tax=Anarrhichthys ocellatus TaxID=433405 RepID=UPI0012EE8A12|nr:XK-related protein 8-like [Anarrhichthys ocellatus]